MALPIPARRIRRHFRPQAVNRGQLRRSPLGAIPGGCSVSRRQRELVSNDLGSRRPALKKSPAFSCSRRNFASEAAPAFWLFTSSLRRAFFYSVHADLKLSLSRLAGGLLQHGGDTGSALTTRRLALVRGLNWQSIVLALR